MSKMYERNKSNAGPSTQYLSRPSDAYIKLRTTPAFETPRTALSASDRSLTGAFPPIEGTGDQCGGGVFLTFPARGGNNIVLPGNSACRTRFRPRVATNFAERRTMPLIGRRGSTRKCLLGEQTENKFRDSKS